MKQYAIPHYLVKLLELGAYNKFIKISTSFLKDHFEMSQQSCSRIINELYSKEYIKKEIIHGGLNVMVTSKGIDYIIETKEYFNLALTKPGYFEMEGRLFTGLGEGSYYMSKRPYKKAFYRKLKIDPFPGTLNLRLEDEKYEKINFRLSKLKGTYIPGFQDQSRTYGPVKCFKAIIEDEYEGAQMFAIRSHYEKNVIEIISSFHLRKELNINDGDLVKVKVYLNNAFID